MSRCRFWSFPAATLTRPSAPTENKTCDSLMNTKPEADDNWTSCPPGLIKTESEQLQLRRRRKFLLASASGAIGRSAAFLSIMNCSSGSRTRICCRPCSFISNIVRRVWNCCARNARALIPVTSERRPVPDQIAFSLWSAVSGRSGATELACGCRYFNDPAGATITGTPR